MEDSRKATMAITCPNNVIHVVWALGELFIYIFMFSNILINFYNYDYHHNHHHYSTHYPRSLRRVASRASVSVRMANATTARYVICRVDTLLNWDVSLWVPLLL